jgi:hypothetical protein
MFTKNLQGVIVQRNVFFAKYLFPNQCCTCEKTLSDLDQHEIGKYNHFCWLTSEKSKPEEAETFFSAHLRVLLTLLPPPPPPRNRCIHLFCATIVPLLAFISPHPPSPHPTAPSFLPKTNKCIFQQRQPVAAAIALMAVRSELS